MVYQSLFAKKGLAAFGEFMRTSDSEKYGKLSKCKIKTIYHKRLNHPTLSRYTYSFHIFDIKNIY